MSNPGFLVEGDLEQKFIQNICPKSPVRKINCNGDDVSIEAIARRVGTLGRLLQKRWRPLIVVFDREQRYASGTEIETQFREALDREDLKVPIIVGIPDRDTETWILADPERFALSAGIQISAISQAYEGKKGKTEIKKLLHGRRGYVETIDGVSWLKQARPVTMKRNSPSFAHFAAALDDLRCWWLQEEHLVSND